jgi:hypothetical protein
MTTEGYEPSQDGATSLMGRSSGARGGRTRGLGAGILYVSHTAAAESSTIANCEAFDFTVHHES